MPKHIAQAPTLEMPWRVLAKQHPRGTHLPQHQHHTGQLVYAISGVMLVEASSSRWTVPPQRALWIPPQHPHSISMLSTTELRTVYFAPAALVACGSFQRQAQLHAITVSRLMRELVLGLFSDSHDAHAHALMAGLLLHTLHQAPSLPTDLPMPRDAALHRAVTPWAEAPHQPLSLDDAAATATLSPRTFTRRFTEEVGLSFRAWRQRARIIASLDLLATERPIKSIAHAMGFASTAAYCAAFKLALGTTPDEFRQHGVEP